MPSATTVVEVGSPSAWFPDVVDLFEDYRRHYGQPAAPVDAGAWLGSRLSRGWLRGFLARRDGEPAGLALVAPTPASLRLGHFWQLRDLFVADRHRRAGVGRALVAHVRDAAEADGALRVSLTTEVDNEGARALYRSLGFTPVDGHATLSLTVGDSA